ncbi:MAG: hypothetical protein FJ020_03530 [Chloroflexi bacterium]|nr:hypothetical protein [Chloroflexota bacterium]
MRHLEPQRGREGEEGILERSNGDTRWCKKIGCIVNNGSSVDVPVWISSDGLLVLPVGGNGGAKAEPGSRIRMSRSIWPVCNCGDLGTVIGAGETGEDTPESWLVTMDSGHKLYVFEGEFAVMG